MKTNKSLPNGCIDDNNVAYTTKIEGYTTSMLYMNELYEIAGGGLKGKSNIRKDALRWNNEILPSDNVTKIACEKSCRRSSVVERSAVNRVVVGSNPTGGVPIIIRQR